MLLPLLSIHNHIIPVEGVRFNAKTAKNDFGPFRTEKINIFICDSTVYNGRCKIYQGVIAIQQGYSVIFTFHGGLL